MVHLGLLSLVQTHYHPLQHRTSSRIPSQAVRTRNSQSQRVRKFHHRRIAAGSVLRMALRKTGSGDATELAEAGWAKPEDVIRSRAGDVLIKNTLLKADHFPGCQNTKLTPLLDGAPNFRQVEGLPVYGVAIPTVRGLRNVMDVLGAAQGQRGVLWHNMREEPVLYINGKPYVVRESDQPFCNVEYTGIDRSRVEDMEARLKRDVLREAARYEQHILVTEEDDDMNVIDVWEPVTESDVQTPMEVYQELVEDGYNVDYTRVPITDEKAPKDSDFELLIQRLWNVPPDAALVFNCQMGRGRTTTGMVIATLVTLRRLGAFSTQAPLAGQLQQQPQQQVANGNGVYPRAAANGASYGSQLQQSVPAWFATSKAAHGSGAGGVGSAGSLGSPTAVSTPRGTEQKLKAGMYGVVRSLLRVLERGVTGKAILDTCLGACSAMQNLREAITTYRGRLMAETKESRRAQLMGVCLEYLERYYMLIAFTSYLTWPKFDPAGPGHVTFQDWMDSRPELRSVLSRMLRRNPLSALELHIPAATLLQDSATGHQGADDDADQAARSQAEARADIIIESRSGAVLGALTILKEDYFPGMKSNRLPQVLPGAGNFRRMAGPPVYGVAMCTLGGIRNVLNAVAQQQEQAGGPKEVMWFNMREEPMVYINGLPFVLREQQRPMKNLQEYAGIDADRLERMEARLKQDVLAEATHHNGSILVARESAAAPGSLTEQHYSGTGELVDMWEPIAGPDAVQTPAEVYAALAAEGLGVRYLRVPVTDGKAPSAGDIDAIMRQVASVGYEHPMVFNCQMGAGRTTTGTVIGGLLAMYGSNIQLPGATTAEDGSTGGAGAAAGGAAAGSALTPVRARLASVPSSTSMDDLSKDIIREELAGDSPRHSEDSDRDSPHSSAGLELRGALSGGTAARAAAAGPGVAAAPEQQQQPPVPRCSSVAELWSDLSPEEVQERVSLAAGGYVGVRRVVRLLEHGDTAKRIVDAVIDASAQMLNLRVAIMRFRRPKHQYHNHKSEVAARHFAYRRGSAYLERYCLLVALGAYLEAEGLRSPTSFEAWLHARPELEQALSNIHSNPATALAAVPVAAVPVLYRSVRGGVEVTPAEQEEVLRKRRGKTLNRRIILKSYLARAADPSLPPGTPDVRQAEGLPVFAVGNVAYDALAKLLLHLGAGPGGNTHVVVTDVREELVVYVNGVPHIRRELEMPAAALHHAGVHARQLELLEAALREDVANEAAKWGGRVLLHQELYTAGTDAARRMSGLIPAGSGGAATPGGSLSLAIHGRTGSSSLPLPIVGSFLTPPIGPVPATAVQLASAIAPSPIAPAGTAVQQARRITGQLPPISPATNGAAADPAGFPGFRPISPTPFAASPAGFAGRASCSSSQILTAPEGAAAASNTTGDDVTAPVDVRPGAAVVPYWEPVELSSSGESSSPADTAAANPKPSQQQQRLRAPPLATCLDVAKQLQAAGFHITYRRIPLSRERTPVPSDLRDMMKQMLALPAGVGPLDLGSPGGGASLRAAQIMRMAAQCAADANRTWSGLLQTAGSGGSNAVQVEQSEQPQQPRSIVHLVVSRTATGSSARFATAAFSTFLTKHSRSESKAAAAGAPGSPHKPGAGAAAANGAAAGSTDGSPSQGPAKRMRRTHSDLGEYRGIMSVARLLPGGLEVKGAVDEAIDRCSAIGNIREDIKACKHNAAAPGQSSDDPGSMAWAARQLGVHYLKRYFLLIAFRCYLVQRQRAEQLGRSAPDFTKWVEDRRELGHLMHHLNLDT